MAYNRQEEIEWAICNLNELGFTQEELNIEIKRIFALIKEEYAHQYQVGYDDGAEDGRVDWD